MFLLVVTDKTARFDTLKYAMSLANREVSSGRVVS